MKNKESMFELWAMAWVGKILAFLAVGGFITIWWHGRIPTNKYWWHIPAFFCALLYAIWAERKTMQTFRDVSE